MDGERKDQRGHKIMRNVWYWAIDNGNPIGVGKFIDDYFFINGTQYQADLFTYEKAIPPMPPDIPSHGESYIYSLETINKKDAQLAKVRERCEHTKWISDRVHHTDAFHGELKLAREILAILEESSCRW